MEEIVKPKYLLLQLIFENDNLNQSSMIDLDGMESIHIDQVPIVESSEVIGSSSKTLKQIRYVITVDYGEGVTFNAETD